MKRHPREKFYFIKPSVSTLILLIPELISSPLQESCWKKFILLTDTGEDSKLVKRRKRPKVDKLFSTPFSNASERRVWLSTESKALASSFGRFRLYRPQSNFRFFKTFKGAKTGSAVKITCEYSPTATVNTDEVTVKSGEASLADYGYGDLSESLSLKFYTDETCSSIDQSGTQVVGDEVYVCAEWDLQGLSDVFNFYIRDCYIQNSNNVGAYTGVKVFSIFNFNSNLITTPSPKRLKLNLYYINIDEYRLFIHQPFKN